MLASWSVGLLFFGCWWLICTQWLLGAHFASTNPPQIDLGGSFLAPFLVPDRLRRRTSPRNVDFQTTQGKPMKNQHFLDRRWPFVIQKMIKNTTRRRSSPGFILGTLSGPDFGPKTDPKMDPRWAPDSAREAPKIEPEFGPKNEPKKIQNGPPKGPQNGIQNVQNRS